MFEVCGDLQCAVKVGTALARPRPCDTRMQGEWDGGGRAKAVPTFTCKDVDPERIEEACRRVQNRCAY
jgi:hypothetical protein